MDGGGKERRKEAQRNGGGGVRTRREVVNSVRKDGWRGGNAGGEVDNVLNVDYIYKGEKMFIRLYVKEQKEEEKWVYLIVAVNGPSDLPASAHGGFSKCQPVVVMVTSCCIGILVVELQHALGQKSLSWREKEGQKGIII